MKSRGTPRAVGDLLLDAMPQLTERLAEERLRRSWTTVVGGEVARRTTPGAIVGGCLDVIVDNSPWLHELTLRRAELTARIQRQAPAISSVRLTLGARKDEDAGPTSRRAPRPRTLTEGERRQVEDAVEAIRDADLSGAARSLLTRAWRAMPAAEHP